MAFDRHRMPLCPVCCRDRGGSPARCEAVTRNRGMNRSADGTRAACDDGLLLMLIDDVMPSAWIGVNGPHRESRHRFGHICVNVLFSGPPELRSWLLESTFRVVSRELVVDWELVDVWELLSEFLSKCSGEVSEWLKEPHSKCGLRVTAAGVRIPPSPSPKRAAHVSGEPPCVCDLSCLARIAIVLSLSFLGILFTLTGLA